MMEKQTASMKTRRRISNTITYVILVLIILSEYTDDFYGTWKKQGKQRNTSSGGLAALGRYFSSITPERRGLLTSRSP